MKRLKKTYEFFKRPSTEEEFEGQITEDILEPFEHKKIENPYVPPRAPKMHKQLKMKLKMKLTIFKKQHQNLITLMHQPQNKEETIIMANHLMTSQEKVTEDK